MTLSNYSMKQISNLPLKFTAFLAGSVLLLSCSGEPKTPDEAKEAPIPVIITRPMGNTGNGLIEASGQVEAIRSANISTRVMGYITQLPVKVGDRVRAGQLLFTVNSADIQAKQSQTEAMIAQADAALQNARKDYDRYTALYQQQSASAKELDMVTLQYQSAKANAAAARAMRKEVSSQLTYTSVTAPFAGTITQKLAETGSMATPGMPVLTIEQEGGLQVSASVPENQIKSVKLGDAATLSVGSANETITGKVTQINPSSQFTGGQYLVKIGIPAEAAKKLYAGMYVQVQLADQLKTPATNTSRAVMVPVKAIVNRDQLTGLYTVSAQQTALLRWVRLGATTGDQVEVLSGLAQDEPFVLSAEGKLYNGAPVKIK
jgi:RND family efflux transporter MFP subunit